MRSICIVSAVLLIGAKFVQGNWLVAPEVPIPPILTETSYYRATTVFETGRPLKIVREDAFLLSIPDNMLVKSLAIDSDGLRLYTAVISWPIDQTLVRLEVPMHELIEVCKKLSVPAPDQYANWELYNGQPILRSKTTAVNENIIATLDELIGYAAVTGLALNEQLGVFATSGGAGEMAVDYVLVYDLKSNTFTSRNELFGGGATPMHLSWLNQNTVIGFMSGRTLSSVLAIDVNTGEVLNWDETTSADSYGILGDRIVRFGASTVEIPVRRRSDDEE